MDVSNLEKPATGVESKGKVPASEGEREKSRDKKAGKKKKYREKRKNW